MACGTGRWLQLVSTMLLGAVVLQSGIAGLCSEKLRRYPHVAALYCAAHLIRQSASWKPLSVPTPQMEPRRCCSDLLL